MSPPRKREKFQHLSRSTKWRRSQSKTWDQDVVDANESDSHSEDIAFPQTPDQSCSYFNANFTLEDQNNEVFELPLPSTSRLSAHLRFEDSSDESSSATEDLAALDQYVWESSDECMASEDSDEDSLNNFDPSNSVLANEVENCSTVEKSGLFLKKWAVETNVNLTAIDKLLKGLKSHTCFSSLPSSGRTLLKTPTTLIKTVVEPGEYIHIGIQKQLFKLVSSLSKPVRCLKLLANIDGLPLFKSSPGDLYPILISVVNIPELKGTVVPVGIYFGKEKPYEAEKLLMPFVQEMKQVVEDGISVPPIMPKIGVSLEGFCCDAPAKSFIMGIVSHNGYYSCTKCTVKGETVEKTRVFLEHNSNKRTHNDFILNTDNNYQRKNTPLVLIPGIDFVSSFVLDYMHLICLGVTRTLLFVWNNGIKSAKTSRLSRNSRILLSGKICELRLHMPSEFVRKPRELNLIMRWKATELRNFLLYVGPIVLRNVLDHEKYINFLELHIATNILLNPKLCKQEIMRENSRKLYTHFVESVAVIYGNNFITHNFHGLTHIVDDADHFLNIIDNFSLNDISAFPFENFLQKMKNLIRGPSKPLEQIGKRLAERFSADITKKRTGKEEVSYPKNSCHRNGPLLALCSEPQYSKAIFPDFKITTQQCDRYCGTEEGDIIETHNICWCQEKKSMVIVGKKFTDKTYYYSNPLSSTELGIFRVKTQSSWKSWTISKITKKFVCLPFKGGYVAFPLLHTVT